MDVNEILLGLLGRALFDSKFTFEIKDVPWTRLFMESRAQAVELLVFDAMTTEERAAMPRDLLEAWQRLALQRLMANEQLCYEQGKILQRLNEAEIPCAVLKGSSCGLNYLNPSLRCAGDIDLLVGSSGVELAREVLEQMGYESANEPHPYHVHMHSKTRIVELHYEPAGIPRGKIGEKIRVLFNGAECRTEIKAGIPVLPTYEQGISLLLHKLEHIVSSGLGLRQLCDWAVFVHRQLAVEDWERLEPVLKDLGLLHFTKIVTRMSVDGLALPVESVPWCMDADSFLAKQLLADILRTGNFGSKENRYGQRLFTDAKSGNRVISFLRVGLQTCWDHWPISKEYPILTPVAPFILLSRYHRQRKNGERPAFRPFEMYKGAKERQALYASLRPFME